MAFRTHVFHRLSSWLAGLEFSFAGWSKTFVPGATENSLIWLGASALVATALELSLVIGETMLGIALLARPLAPRLRWAAVIVLGGFSVILAVFAASPDPPACGCLGLVALFDSARTEAVAGL